MSETKVWVAVSLNAGLTEAGKDIRISHRDDNARLVINAVDGFPVLEIEDINGEKIAYISIRIPEDFITAVTEYMEQKTTWENWQEDFKQGKIQERNRMGLQARENGEKILSELPEPLNWIYGELLEANIERWINNPAMDDTIGQESVLKYGFTENQMKWLDEIQTNNRK